MTSTFGKQPLKGIVPPMVTPLIDIDTLDLAGTEKLIEHILSAPVSGLFILGTTGEFSSISYKLRHQLIDFVCKQVNGRVPVLVGITDTSIIESANLAKRAADAGASAVVSAPPFYYAAAQPELVEYYQNLVPRLPLPLYLYNMPVHTKVMIDPGTVRKIAEDKKVIGLKDSSANAVYFNMVRHAMKDRPDFELFMGPEEITAEAVLMGANGGVNGGANMFPKLYVDMYEAAANQNFETLKPLHDKILQVSSTIYTIGRYGSSYLKGVKTSLSLMGICSDFIADPFHRFRKEERDRVRRSLEAMGIKTFN